MATGEILFKTASSENEFSEGKNLFYRYADSLDLDLSFQDFSTEIKAIEKQYNKPKGALILAYNAIIAVGCVGIREFDTNTAELKRMYVEAEYRKLKIGSKLLQLAIEFAKESNYKKIRLDTLPVMQQAQSLYKSFGFYEIPSYRFNPFNGAVFMEKKLV